MMAAGNNKMRALDARGTNTSESGTATTKRLKLAEEERKEGKMGDKNIKSDGAAVLGLPRPRRGARRSM